MNKKETWKSTASAIWVWSMIISIIAISMAGTVSAKSLYVNKDLNNNSPISAYDIQPAPTYLVHQMTSSPTRSGGAGLAIDTDSQILFITFEGSGTLYIVNATTLTKIGQVTAPNARNLAGIVVDQEKKKVYTVDRNTNHSYVYSWDAITHTLTNDITTSPFYVSLSGINTSTVGGGMYGIALDEVHDLLYVADNSNAIKIFNTADWSSAGTFPITQRAMGIAVDVSEGFVYTGNAYPGYGSLSLLSKYDLNTNTESTLDIRTLSGAVISDNVLGLAVDPATSLLYITTGNQASGGSDRIIVFDSDLNMLNATGDIGNPTGIVVPGKEISYNPLNLQKSDGLSTCVNPGNTVTYTMSYSNGNPTDVSGVILKDTLPAETTFVSASNGGTLSGNVVTWDIGSVTQGSSGQVTLDVQIKSDTLGGTTITNSATIDSDQTPPTTQSETTDTCSNRPPVAEAGGPYSTNEGTSVTVDASGSSDPDGDTLTYAWDLDNDGTYETPGLTATITPSDGPATLTVGLQVSDGKGGVSTDTALITVNNVAPSVNAGADQSSDEGDTVSFSGSFTDPGSDTYTISWDFGDSSPAITGMLTPSHVYADNGVYTVTLTVADDDGGIGIDTLIVTVNNIAPAVGPITSPLDPKPVNTQIDVSSPFTDPGTLDTHTATWDWNDGTTSAGTVTESGGSGTVTGSHVFVTAGIYIVKLTVIDKDGGEGTAVASQFIVVYDPNDGFVTGGGFIDSPAGAYIPDPALAGKANFGFVSKYQKGATIPTGETEFQLKVGNLNFHSATYDWLVIAGSRAQYKGTGTINGAGDFGFLLTAVDGQITGGGGVDKFRIKIWDRTTDTLIYDNAAGTDDVSGSPTQVISGGSIVIHNK